MCWSSGSGFSALRTALSRTGMSLASITPGTSMMSSTRGTSQTKGWRKMGGISTPGGEFWDEDGGSTSSRLMKSSSVVGFGGGNA